MEKLQGKDHPNISKILTSFLISTGRLPVFALHFSYPKYFCVFSSSQKPSQIPPTRCFRIPYHFTPHNAPCSQPSSSGPMLPFIHVFRFKYFTAVRYITWNRLSVQVISHIHRKSGIEEPTQLVQNYLHTIIRHFICSSRPLELAIDAIESHKADSLEDWKTILPITLHSTSSNSSTSLLFYVFVIIKNVPVPYA